jgi:hypothetical protein
MAETTAIPRATMDEIRAQVAAESQSVDHIQWQTEIARLGIAGVNLTTGKDALPAGKVRQLTNGVPLMNGGVQTRPGLTVLTQGGANIHSAYRLNDSKNATSILLWGVDGNLAWANSGAFNYAYSGFSGKPLSFSSWETEYAGEPWAFIADANQMAKMRSDGLALPIGLPKAAQPTSIVVQAPLVTPVCTFTSSDFTGANDWSPIQGYGTDGLTAGLPSFGGTESTLITITPGLTAKPYYSGMSVAHAVDLTTLPNPLGGTITSTDQDLIHFSLRVTNPEVISEVRLYFVVGPYTDAAIPGLSVDVSGVQPNSSAYARAFRMSDYTTFLNLTGTALDAASQQRAAAVTAGQEVITRTGRLRYLLKTGVSNQATQQAANTAAKQALVQSQFTPLVGSPVNMISSAQLPGADVWVEYGIVGRPLRKADFLKIGNAGEEGFTWANVSGIVIVILTTIASPTTLDFDDMYLTGGYDPDVSEPDSAWYDYRVCNVDKRTGARSNPSDVMYADADNKNVYGISCARQLITVHPSAYGDGNIFQEVYRRGGSLVDTWYGPVADNKATGDGQPLVDTMSDVTALATGSVDIDHDQPVTTTAANGDAIYAQPLGFLLPGPINGYLIGGGDPNRPGDIYWCKQGEPDHWPAFNHQQVCPPSETLLNGGMYGGQAFIFSRERMYSVQVGFGDSPISSSPTDCAQGPVGRWAITVGPGGIYFASRDAVRVTQGGISVPISDDIRPLFHGETVDGYYPIDFSQPDAIRLDVHGDDIWFGFINTNGTRDWWVFSLIYKTWRNVTFAPAIGMAYSDQALGEGLKLILGGSASGRAYLHTGVSDNGASFTVKVRTGALLATTREEKLFGDVAVWGDFTDTDPILTTRLDVDQVVNTSDTVIGQAGYREYLLHPFGEVPQHAQSISFDAEWTSGAATPATLYQFGISVAVQPEITMKRATTWQPLNTNGEAYLTGCWIDSDTFGNPIDVIVEALLGGVRTTITTLTITSDAGRRQWFDWPAVHCDMIRLRPVGDCEPWMLYGQGWLWRPEPARLPGMDSGFINLGDTYYTGLDLEIDTFGADKRVIVVVDGNVTLIDPATSVAVLHRSTPSGRLDRHITLPWGRGHIYRFYVHRHRPGPALHQQVVRRPGAQRTGELEPEFHHRRHARRQVDQGDSARVRHVRPDQAGECRSGRDTGCGRSLSGPHLGPARRADCVRSGARAGISNLPGGQFPGPVVFVGVAVRPGTVSADPV